MQQRPFRQIDVFSHHPGFGNPVAVVLDAQGQVTLHRDYWDAAEELYEKLPVVGALMRWLKKRANS